MITLINHIALTAFTKFIICGNSDSTLRPKWTNY